MKERSRSILLVDFSIFHYGDSAICVEFSKSFKEDSWRRAHKLANELRAQDLDGVLSIIPTFTTVLVQIDLYKADFFEVKEHIKSLVSTLNEKHTLQEQNSYRVPVVYGGEFGLDLPKIANQIGCTENEVINFHSKNPNRVLCFTSPAGQPLMDGSLLPDSVSRLDIPYTKIPEGSVGVVGNQTTIYARESPGGWGLIGRTPINITTPSIFPPSPLKPGDLVQFFKINNNEWDHYKNQTLIDLKVKYDV